MTTAEMAALHRRCFSVPRPYTEIEIAELISSVLCFLCLHPNGFAIGRVISDEAELLTLAVDPDHRRKGVARKLLDDFENCAKARGARHVFLEVAEGNTAARALYHNLGYQDSGRRAGYYRQPGGSKVDAILMTRGLTDD